MRVFRVDDFVQVEFDDGRGGFLVPAEAWDAVFREELGKAINQIADEMADELLRGDEGPTPKGILG